MEAFFLAAIIQHDVKTAGQGDDELVQILVCVSAAFRAARHIVKIIDALDVKRHMASALDEGQVAARFGNLGQVDDFAPNAWG